MQKQATLGEEGEPLGAVNTDQWYMHRLEPIQEKEA